MVTADSKAKNLEDAERYVLHGKMQQAIGEYLKIIKYDPNDVLILNTIGDLYLRQGNSSEANKYFSQVAENYVSNNFFLKAIAVYKKILNAEPDNLNINSIMASLYARQGLSIDARNQYLRVTALLEKEGKSKEAKEAYEKIVELDPTNSTIQRKLAELYFSEGQKEKSFSHWTGAARAQAKAGDFTGAIDSFGQAMQLDPLNVEAMRGFFDCCLKLDNPAPAINQLDKSIEMAPTNPDFREMLGKAYLASRDLDRAAKTFHIVLSMDESRYPNIVDVANGWVESKEYDQALNCLDTIIPILISRRETGRAVQLYERILQLCPTHVIAMTRLSSIYSATGDQDRYLDELDRIADYYLENKNFIETIEYLEKILQVNPSSEKHRKLHFQAFTQAYPDTPYVAPVEARESISMPDTSPAKERMEPAAAGQAVPSELVEVDLLINYGLRDKALSLLHSLETRDPYDKEVRLRILSIYKGEKKYTEAAEQCLLLAALYRMANSEEAAQSYLNEAKQWAPEMGEYEKDLQAFAHRYGIKMTPAAGTVPTSGTHAPGQEVDLSSDLLDIFFAGDQESATEEDEIEIGEPSDDVQEPVTEPYPQNIPARTASRSVEEQLQEVDFYIRLGFHDEALAKLNEIAKLNPGNPELASRYQKLGEIEKPADQKPAASEPPSDLLFGEPIQSATPDNIEIFRELEMDGTLDNFAISTPAEFQEMQYHEKTSAPPAPAKTPLRAGADQTRLQTPVAEEPAKSDFQANEMFADLMDEVADLSDQEVSKESFEDHFSLGTAYRDMELSEEAIREFEFALKIASQKKDGQRIIQCCGMLSTCFLKKGMPASAMRWCQTGLNITDISSHEAMALRYDMAIAHSMSGSNERALECFDQIFALDPSYRDVAQRIDELKGGFERHAP
jgi:tetratricopeptide (TPR) repeat protein